MKAVLTTASSLSHALTRAINPQKSPGPAWPYIEIIPASFSPMHSSFFKHRIMKNILKQSHFTEHLANLNNLQFNQWIFDPGMLFSSEMKWWGEKGKRGSRHNGLDLRFYKAGDGMLKAIDEGTKIPIIYEGKIVSSIKDFLGYTLFAAHEVYDADSQLFTIYGHVLQSPDVTVGGLLEEGSVIATLAGESNARVPSHLHISIVMIPRSIPAEALAWKILDDNKVVRFFDPQLII